MKELKELVSIASRGGTKAIKIESASKRDPGMVYQLITGVQEGRFSDDNTAAGTLYPGSTSADQRYRMLKSRVRAMLYEYVLKIDTAAEVPGERDCLGYLTRAKLFLQTNSLVLAEKQAKKGIAIAQEEEFTELVLMGLRIRRQIEAALQRPKYFSKIKKEIASYEALFKAEEDAETLYQTQNYRISKSDNSRRYHLDDTPTVLKELWQVWVNTRSTNVLRMVFALTVSYGTHSADHETVRAYLAEIESFLAKSSRPVSGIQLADLQAAVVQAYLKGKLYSKGREYATAALVSMSATPQHMLLEYAFICALRAKAFEQASAISHSALAHVDRKRNATDNLRWKVLTAYLSFWANAQEGQAIALQPFDDKELIKAAKEPALVICVCILKLLHLLERGATLDFLQVFPEIDTTMRGYRSDNGEEVKRLDAFQSLLRVLIESRFGALNEKMLAKSPLARLKTESDPYSQTEIIPFDEVWAYMLALCSKMNSELHFGKQ